jgi:hypothetical protein
MGASNHMKALVEEIKAYVEARSQYYKGTYR